MGRRELEGSWLFTSTGASAKEPAPERAQKPERLTDLDTASTVQNHNHLSKVKLVFARVSGLLCPVWLASSAARGLKWGGSAVSAPGLCDGVI